MWGLNETSNKVTNEWLEKIVYEIIPIPAILREEENKSTIFKHFNYV